MRTLHGVQLVNTIRKTADQVKRRLWIAVPYIGSDKTITSVLGVKWFEDPKISVKLLTDASDFSKFNLSSLKLFIQRGEIKDLLGLHAKIYIIDDSCFITSANLTKTAFSKRYEIGLLVDGKHIKDIEGVFENWWKKATRIETIRINKVMSSSDNKDSAEEKYGIHLPTLNEMPKSINISNEKIKKKFLDYPLLLDEYKKFTKIYSGIQRVYPKAPLYLEIDTFLNYLYHEAPRTPSNSYKDKPARYLSYKTQLQTIKKYAKDFKYFCKSSENYFHMREQLRSHKMITEILQERKIKSLSKKDILNVFNRVNALNSYPINKIRILNNNSLHKLRENLFNLLYGDDNLSSRMNKCSEVEFMGTSTMNEIVGYHNPYKYPIINGNSSAGMRFLGFSIPIYR